MPARIATASSKTKDHAIDVQSLVDAALQAQRLAYAPYSGFAVGAALLSAAGDTFTGCNVENASYGLTVCAERVALQSAVAAGQREFVALAVATAGGLPPCGACRQVLAEFAADLPIFLIDVNRDGRQEQLLLADLLPRGFSLR
jgi:cytidine deaminase